MLRITVDFNYHWLNCAANWCPITAIYYYRRVVCLNNNNNNRKVYGFFSHSWARCIERVSECMCVCVFVNNSNEMRISIRRNIILWWLCCYSVLGTHLHYAIWLRIVYIKILLSTDVTENWTEKKILRRTKNHLPNY